MGLLLLGWMTFCRQANCFNVYVAKLNIDVHLLQYSPSEQKNSDISRCYFKLGLNAWSFDYALS